MYREYDLFEKFSDGSSLWRASVLGIEETCLHLRELALKSSNRFYAIDTLSGKVVYLNTQRGSLEFLAPRRIGRKSSAAIA